MSINEHASGNTDGTTQHHRGSPMPKASTKTDGGVKREGTYAPDQSKMTDNEEIAAQKCDDTTTMKEMMTGKDQTRKSKEIPITPAQVRKETIAAVTPANQKTSEREQKSSKKKQAEQKRTMDQYFGPGERVPPPSKGGTPVQLILMRRLTKAATGVDGGMQTPKQKDKEGKRN
jgi:hypothetical protein